MVLLLWIIFSVLCLLCLCVRLFIFTLWPPAVKFLTTWLSFVVSNCMIATFPLVSWVRSPLRCGTWLYRFLVIAPLLTLVFFTFIVFFVSCLWSLYSNFCCAYCVTPTQTTVEIHNVIFTLMLGSSSRNYDVTPCQQNIFLPKVGKRFLSVSLILGNDCKAMQIVWINLKTG